MNARIPTLVAYDERIDPAVVEALMAAEEIDVVGYVDQIQGSWTSSAIASASALVVMCSGDDNATRLIEAGVEHAEGRPVIAVCTGGQNGYVSELFAAGAADIVRLPSDCTPALARAVSYQVSFSLQKALVRVIAPKPGVSGAGRMICTLGLKGGSGKTLTTANLGASLADAGQRVTIVDLDLQFGDVGLALGLKPEQTMYDLMMSGGSMDAEKVMAFTVGHPSGLRALLAPVRPDQAGAITIDFLKEVFGLLRLVNDFVLVDTPPSFTPEVIAAVDGSSDICMVGMLDALSLKNTKLGLETLELMGYDPERITLVLNRSDSRVGIGLDDVLAIVGRSPDVMVPSDRNVTRSVNEGMPVSLQQRRSEAARAFHGLAAQYMPAEATVQRRRMFRRARAAA